VPAWTFTQFGQLGAGMTESASGRGLIVADQRSSAIVTQISTQKRNFSAWLIVSRFRAANVPKNR
jgi:hypothetical protein